MYIAKLLLLLLSPIIGATCALLLLLPHSECTLTRFNYWIIAIIPAGSKLIKRKRLWNLLGKWEIENWFALCCCCCRWCQFHSFQLSKTSLVSQRSSAQLCFSLKEDACCWRCASCQNVDGGRPFSLLLNSASAAFDISRLCTHTLTSSASSSSSSSSQKEEKEAEGIFFFFFFSSRVDRSRSLALYKETKKRRTTMPLSSPHRVF